MNVIYNKDGNKIEEIYLNAKLENTNNSEGIHKTLYQYDKTCLSKTTKAEDCYSLIQYFDLNQKPTVNKKQISKTITQYDESGRIKSIQNFLADDTRSSRRIYSYELGNKKEIAWETYKNNILNRAVYNMYIYNPFSTSKPIVKITLNKLNRPIAIKLGK